ncbi:hypothetical protein EAI35_13460 [Enterobacter bugandensis]|nr:hypothetical protein EAI35_13460 [Enterobacter bugandensis]
MCVGCMRSPQSLTHVSSRRFTPLPPSCNSNYLGQTSLTNCVLDTPTSLYLGTSVRDKKCIINEHPILRNFYTALRTD